MTMIEWKFRNTLGQQLRNMQTEDTPDAYEKAGIIAQQLANKTRNTVLFTAWKDDGEGGTRYRYPKGKGRPPTGEAMTSAQRIKRLRDKRKAAGLCICCGQPLPFISDTF